MGHPHPPLHAVALGLVAEGVALDEGTCVEVGVGDLRVHGLGSAYRVRAAAGGDVTVTPLAADKRPDL